MNRNPANTALAPVCVAGVRINATTGCNVGNVNERESRFTTHIFVLDLLVYRRGNGKCNWKWRGI